MDYYNNAVTWYNSAKFSLTGEFYQQSVSQSCLAVELFLKSKLSKLRLNYSSQNSILNCQGC